MIEAKGRTRLEHVFLKIEDGCLSIVVAIGAKQYEISSMLAP